jgi:ATP-binding protein involved in chromosome partitioning
MNIPLLGQVPIVMSIREGGDSGLPVAWNEESATGIAFEQMALELIRQLERRNIYFEPTVKVKVTRK